MVNDFTICTYTNNAMAEKLLNSGQFYTSLFDTHPDAVYAVDKEGHFILANPALQTLTGYTLEELIQQKFSMLKTSDPEVRKARFEQAFSGIPQKYETLVYHKDGHTIDTFVTLVPIFIDGTVVGVFGFAKDISEQKRKEAQLRTAQTLFRLLSENSQDLITISDPNGFTQYITPSVTTKLGYAPHEVIGMPAETFYHPEDRGPLSMQTFSDAGTFECRVRHKSGHYLWFETTYKNIKNDMGQVEYVVGVGRDITIRKQAEEELLETKEFLDSFIDQNVDAIVFCDRENKIIRANDAFQKMFGWEIGEIVGLLEDVQTIGSFTSKDRVVIGEERKRVRKDGNNVYVRVSYFPLKQANGDVQGVAFVIRDITEQKKAEELLLQTEKLSVAGQLAAGIAHEIRNPLTALKGFTQLMKSGDNEHKEYLKIMEMEMNRIESILSELLVLAKPQANEFDKQVDLTVLILDVISLMQSQANMYNIEIVLQHDTDVPRLSCDKNQLKQVFINFVKNAIEAMPRGGQLLIELKQMNEQQIRVRFQDQGVGIPPSLLKRIGEPFYTTKEKGTGLGMMVSKKIIELHRGKLNIESQVQVGTSVEVILPTTN